MNIDSNRVLIIDDKICEMTNKLENEVKNMNDKFNTNLEKKKSFGEGQILSKNLFNENKDYDEKTFKTIQFIQKLNESNKEKFKNINYFVDSRNTYFYIKN